MRRERRQYGDGLHVMREYLQAKRASLASSLASLVSPLGSVSPSYTDSVDAVLSNVNVMPKTEKANDALIVKG